jgi:hypothetical protein
MKVMVNQFPARPKNFPSPENATGQQQLGRCSGTESEAEISGAELLLAAFVSRLEALKKDLESLGCVVNVRIGGEIKVPAKKPRTKTDKRKASRGKKTT